MPNNTQHASPDPWLNRVIDNRYRIEERIGRGGMGTVYKVVHTQMGKIAAMKVLHGSLAKDRELVKRFHQEATAISKLNHPNIVQVFDFGRVDSTMYLVMEFLKGEDLALILKRNGPLSVTRCCPILTQICDALIEAHGLNIIHRDLKPENVRVARTRDGQDFVKVLDFGLAKMLEEEEYKREESITQRGSLVGTPYYMAPEMIRAKPLDHRIDIYSLGAVAYRMLTAQNAFVAKTPLGVLTKHLSEEAMPPSQRVPERNLPPAVDAIVLQAMAKNPDRRYQTVEDLKRDLVQLHASLQSQELSNPYVEAARRTSDNGQILPMAPTAPPRLIYPVPTGEVLSKEDLAFERRLTRGRSKLWLLLVPLLAAGIALYLYRMQEVPLVAPTSEEEPNNTPARAIRVLRDRPITGHLGQRVSGTESDRDWYKFTVKADKPQMVQARVSGVPNMDITLELFDSAAGRITGADSSGKGGGEVIPNWVVDPGDYYLLVREVWLTGVPPTENVTDSYQLQVGWQPYSREWELEPNDRPEQANLVQPGESVKGYLGAVNDVDIFRIASDAGLLAGMASGIDGVDIVLEISVRGSDESRTVDEEGTGAGERFRGIRVRKGAPVQILLRRKADEKVLKGIKATARGLDEAYTLKTWIVPMGK
jgi:serine/threonine-protein kinase